MWQYLLVIFGFVALLIGWVYFQQWLQKHDPDAQKYSPGCGACSKKGSCSK
jgi:hypothetical protein